MAACALLWSLAGLFIKLIDWNPFAIACGRSLIASVFILTYLGKPKFTFSRAQVGAAVASAATMLLFIYANKATSSANAILLQYGAPIYTAGIGLFLLKERPRSEQWIALIAILGGMVLFFMDDLGGGHLAGNLAAAASGFTFALYIVLMRAQKDGSPLESALLAHVLTAVIAFAIALFLPPPRFTLQATAAMLGLGLLQIGLATVLFAYGIKRVTAIQSVLMDGIEPVIEPGLGLLGDGRSPARQGFDRRLHHHRRGTGLIGGDGEARRGGREASRVVSVSAAREDIPSGGDAAREKLDEGGCARGERGVEGGRARLSAPVGVVTRRGARGLQGTRGQSQGLGAEREGAALEAMRGAHEGRRVLRADGRLEFRATLPFLLHEDRQKLAHEGAIVVEAREEGGFVDEGLPRDFGLAGRRLAGGGEEAVRATEAAARGPKVLASFAMRSRRRLSKTGSMGLARQSTMPAEVQAARRPGSARAVMAAMGAAFSAAVSESRRLAASKPSMSGRPRSRRMRSKFEAAGEGDGPGAGARPRDRVA